jgi:hypothetical protein
MAANARGNTNYVMDWLVGQWQWPAACMFAACAMLLLMPVWIATMGTALALVALQLPLYMVHEWEEHTADRFRKYVNQNIAGGYDALTRPAAFWINAIGVWGLELVSLYLACFVKLSFGLIALYLPLVNALIHIGQAVMRREYNPGLWTSLALFVPISGWGLYVVSTQSAATWVGHAVDAGIVVVVHLGLVIYMVLRVGRLRATTAMG